MYNEHAMFADSDQPLLPLNSYKKLDNIKSRLGLGIFLVEGKRAVYHIIQMFPERIVELLLLEGSLPLATSHKCRFLTARQFQSISQMETPQKIMAVVRLPEYVYADSLPANPGPRILCLEDVQDPGNVGTLIRTAAAFDFDGVILSEKCADPFSPKCVQASAGCLLSVWIRRSGVYPGLVQQLQRNGFSFVAADISGTTDPSVLKNREKLVLALGNEARGLSQKLLQLADTRIQIPIDQGKAESLNVATSGAILMYVSQT